MAGPVQKLRSDQAFVELAEELRKAFPEQDQARKRLEQPRLSPSAEGFDEADRLDRKADQLKTLGDTLIAVALDQNDRNRDGLMDAMEMHRAREFLKDAYEGLKALCPLPSSNALEGSFFKCLSNFQKGSKQ